MRKAKRRKKKIKREARVRSDKEYKEKGNKNIGNGEKIKNSRR